MVYRLPGLPVDGRRATPQYFLWGLVGTLRSYARDPPPVGGHRGGGQARDGVDLVLLVLLVGWVCSSSAQKEAKKSGGCFQSLPSRRLVLGPAEKLAGGLARGASARLRLVGHLRWVHRHEARPVGQPRERMMPPTERR